MEWPPDFTPHTSSSAAQSRPESPVASEKRSGADRFRRLLGYRDTSHPLLSDTGHEVASQFGVWALKKNGSEGIHRTTFVIRDGKVAEGREFFEDTAKADEFWT